MSGESGTFKMYVSPGSSSFSGGRIYLSATQTPAAGVGLSPIPFNATDFDTDAYTDVAHNRIVIPTGFGGWFKVTMRIGIAPQTNGLSAGNIAIFLLTVSSGIRDYEYRSWQELKEYFAFSNQIRVISTLNLADGQILYSDFQDATSGSGGFYIFGGDGGGVAAPESYLEVLRLGDA